MSGRPGTLRQAVRQLADPAPSNRRAAGPARYMEGDPMTCLFDVLGPLLTHHANAEAEYRRRYREMIELRQTPDEPWRPPSPPSDPDAFDLLAMPATPWDTAVFWFMPKLTVPGVDEDQLREHVVAQKLGKLSTDELSVDIARLDRAGAAEELLKLIWEKHFDEACQLSLPARPLPEDHEKRNTLCTSWYHEATADPPEEFGHNGPLAGMKKELAEWLEMDQRTLAKKCRRGIYWARCLKKGNYEVYFKARGVFTKANSRRLDLEAARQAAMNKAGKKHRATR